MPSLFSKRSKSKILDIQLEDQQTSPKTNTMKQEEQHENPQIRPVLKTSPTNQSSLKLNRRRASSNSPHRKLYTNSVTFESTLPTEIWQASPNPSPPLYNWDENNSCVPDQRMFTSVVEAYKQELSGKPDSANTNVESSIHSQTTTKLYKCLSDADLNKIIYKQTKDRISIASTLISTSDTSSEESVNGMRNKKENKESIRMNRNLSSSSSSSTATTESNSSLDVRTIEDGLHAQHLQSHVKPRNDRSSGGRKKSCPYADDKRRRRKKISMTTNNGGQRSSSSTSEDDADLEVFGWDEKTIRAVTSNRMKKNKQVYGMKNSEYDKTLSNRQILSPIPTGLELISPLASYEVYSPTRQHGVLFPDHPRSCLLGRKVNVDQPVDRYVNHENQTCQLKICGYQEETLRSKGLNSELLAVVTTDYEPSADWKEQYKAISVHKGDYVSVLSAPLPSRNSLTIEPNKQINNSWLYVRRWCSDHLVATGAPGFVPRHYCRLLQSSEILSMWHKAQHKPQSCPHVINQDPNTNLRKWHLPNMAAVPNTQVAMHPVRTQSSQQPIQYKSHYEFLPMHSVGMRVNYRPSIHGLCVTSQQSHIPPPPPICLGSGGSIGSETEDRDSGRGPSSGSEWSSARGGSSTIMLDGQLVMEQALYDETGLKRMSGIESDTSFRISGSVDETQLGWYPNDGSIVSGEQATNRKFWSPDSALQSPIGADELTPQLSLKTVHYASPIATRLQEFPSPITLTTRLGGNPVLELRPTTVNPVNQIRRIEQGTSQTNSPQGEQISEENSSYWEPYKTVIHVNENTLEKFTLV